MTDLESLQNAIDGLIIFSIWLGFFFGWMVRGCWPWVHHKSREFYLDWKLARRSKKQSGFTTLEMVLVIAFIGGLALYTMGMADLVQQEIDHSPFAEYQQMHNDAIKRYRSM